MPSKQPYHLHGQLIVAGEALPSFIGDQRLVVLFGNGSMGGHVVLEGVINLQATAQAQVRLLGTVAWYRLLLFRSGSP